MSVERTEDYIFGLEISDEALEAAALHAPLPTTRSFTARN
jgi:hypothetical protein